MLPKQLLGQPPTLTSPTLTYPYRFPIILHPIPLIQFPQFMHLSEPVISMRLQEVVRSSGALMPTFIPWRWVELREFDVVMNCLLINITNIIIHLHYRGLITTSVAIVRSRENSHHRSIVLPLITLHHKLMGSGNEVKIVNMGELFCNVLPKRVTRSSWRNPPATPVIRVRPHKITHGPFVGDFLHTVQVPGMIKSINRGGESTMETENTICDHGCHGKIIEGVCEMLPHIGVSIFSQAFVIETINLSDLTTLVISTEDCDAIPIPNFQRHQKRHSLQRIVPTIDIIPHEQVIRLWTCPPDPE
mmetsp:Transcript_5576/g.10002  ORF Transcript_5576/g.10002 Transcript_5576/m.10002 type:complete len:303 (+) Transcript_5576:159-1067(+)